jgi:hypothetical protein
VERRSCAVGGAASDNLLLKQTSADGSISTGTPLVTNLIMVASRRGGFSRHTRGCDCSLRSHLVRVSGVSLPTGSWSSHICVCCQQDRGAGKLEFFFGSNFLFSGVVRIQLWPWWFERGIQVQQARTPNQPLACSGCIARNGLLLRGCWR